MKPKRIGVLTGGGDCPGLNAVIRAVTKTALYRHGIEVFGIEDGVIGLIEDRMHPLGSDDVSNILTLGGTILGTSSSVDPRRYPVERDGKMECENVQDRIVENVRKRGLDAVVCIGGDGTMTMAHEMLAGAVGCIGVPKTIDNDIVGCDRTFGFDSAVTTATESLDKLHTTAMSHHRVMIVEVMGRNAGWLALHAGVASGSDVILIPEMPYDLDAVCRVALERSRCGKRFSIMCVSEAARPIGGEVVAEALPETHSKRRRLGGFGAELADDVEEATGLETRATILGHVQRSGTPTPFDRVLATRFGYQALELLVGGAEAKLVVWRDGTVQVEDIASVAHRQRTVPPDHPLLDTARAVGTSFGV